MRLAHLATLAAITLLIGRVDAQTGFVFDRIMLTGETATGLEPARLDEIGPYVDIFNDDPFAAGPQIGIGGGIAIPGQVGGDGRPSTTDGFGTAVWRATGASLQLLAASGDAAPGTSGLLFGIVGMPFDHDDGIAFAATATATGSFDRAGIWSNRGGILRRLLLEGEPLAGIPAGATMHSQFAFVARGNAVVAEARWCFEGSCALRDEGLFRDRTGALQPVVVRGTQAPGISGAVFDDFSNASANTGPVHRWNAGPGGRVIFNGYVRGTRIDSGNNEGMWMETPGGLVLLAREGEAVPGLKGGWRWGAASGFQGFGDFTVMQTPAVSANGLALFGASITNRKFNRFGGVWTTKSGTVAQLVQTVRRDPFVGGQPPQNLASPAPGFPAGSYFRQVFSGRINAAGDVYLDADVVHESDPFTPTAAIFRAAPGEMTLRLFARAGGNVPGIGGATFTAIGIGHLLETGHYFWTARIEGAGVTPQNDRVAFLTHPNGTTQLILRSGSIVDGRTVSAFAQPGDPVSGGNRVEQVFEIHFADGSAGVYRLRSL
jgi:hypothetical protein